MNSHSPPAAKQCGMAIISALLIAVVVAVIAGAMLTRHTVFTRSLEAEQREALQVVAPGQLDRCRQRDDRRGVVAVRGLVELHADRQDTLTFGKYRGGKLSLPRTSPCAWLL